MVRLCLSTMLRMWASRLASISQDGAHGLSTLEKRRTFVRKADPWALPGTY